MQVAALGLPMVKFSSALKDLTLIKSLNIIEGQKTAFTIPRNY